MHVKVEILLPTQSKEYIISDMSMQKVSCWAGGFVCVDSPLYAWLLAPILFP